MSTTGRRSAIAMLGLAALVAAGTLPADAADPGPLVQGTLLQVAVDEADGSDHEALELHSVVQVGDELIAVDGAPVQAPTGSPVQMRRHPSGTAATVVEVTPVAAAQVEGAVADALVSGVHTVTVVPVYWTAPGSATTDDLLQVATAAGQYWQQQTDNRLSMSASVRPWTSISAPAGCDSADMSGVMSRALAASGVASPSATNHVVVYFPSFGACGWAGQASIGGGAVWVNGLTYVDVFAHELGHNLGLGHAKTATCGSAPRVSLSAPLSGCSIATYGDYADVMGIAMAATTGNLNSAMADYLGVAVVDRVGAGTDRTDTLAPLSAIGSLRAIAVPSTLGTVYVDYRPAAGRDVRMPGWAGVQVHLRTLDPVYGYPETYLLDMAPGTPSPFSAPQLAAGAAWDVPGSGLTVQTTSISGGAAAVRVRPTSAPPVTPAGDPIASYITRVYRDLFNRGVDPTGLATWSGLLSSGTPRGAVADAITGSEEFRGTLIGGAYATYLGRGPEPAGLAFWLAQMRSGMTIQQMESGFLASTEYYVSRGGTDELWIRGLYADVLGRAPSADEVGFWRGKLAQGMTRAGVSLGFFMSTEHLTSQVDAQYRHLLARGIDPTGAAWWVGKIQSGVRFEAIIGGIVGSEEYYGRR